MRSKMKRPVVAMATLALMGLFVVTGSVSAQGWGTIKGKVIYDPAEKKLPDNPPVNVTADKGVCLAKGPILRNEWVVDPKSRGVKWVLVWLSDATDFKSPKWDPKKIHPSLKAIPKTVELDQPVCTFTPRVIGMREGSLLVANNTTPIAHNVSYKGGALGPTINQLIPKGGKLEVKNVKARHIPFEYNCSIHPWMKGWIGVFNHPYYAVTNEKGEFEIKNAPVGKWRLQIWHEGYGFVQKSSKDRGIVINIKANGTTDVGSVKIKKED